MRLVTALSVMVMSVALAGCTLGRPPSPRGIPSAESLTPGEEITVAAGQNVYAIARKHDVAMSDLIAINHLKAPFALRMGQRLVLPRKPEEPRDDGALSLPPVPRDDVERTDLPPLAPLGGTAGATAPVAPALTLPAAPTETPPTDKPLLTTVQSAQPVLDSKPPSASASAAPESPPPPALKLAWPLQGPIVSTFGPKAGGLTNDGINIAAPKGSPVTAAGNGIVVYAGSEMKGLGNLVLIRHEDKVVTAYAHLDRILVARDSVVAKGDMIGTVGNTGGVGTPQLHFEVRQNGKPTDPRTWIGAS